MGVRDTVTVGGLLGRLGGLFWFEGEGGETHTHTHTHTFDYFIWIDKY